MNIPTWKELRALFLAERCKNLMLSQRIVELERQLKYNHRREIPHDSILEEFEKECG